MGAGGIINDDAEVPITNDNINIDFIVNLTLKPDFLNIVLAGLNELPRKHSEPVFQVINQQVRNQYELIKSEREAQKGRGVRPPGEGVPALPGQSGVSNVGIRGPSGPSEGGKDT